MIVSDDTVSKALAYLAEDPHPLALARKEVTDRENESRRIYSELYLKTSGQVKERECTTDTHPDIKTARMFESEAIKELERHKARTKAAEMIIEVWRSENANARAAEKVR